MLYPGSTEALRIIASCYFNLQRPVPFLRGLEKPSNFACIINLEIIYLFYLLLAGLGVELRTLSIPDKCPTTEPHSQLSFWHLILVELGTYFAHQKKNFF